LQKKKNLDEPWSWVGDPEAKPEILIMGETTDFTVTTDKLLADEDNNDPVRRRKRSFKKDKFYRFGKVKVYGFSDGVSSIPLDDKRDVNYILEFYDHID